MSMIGKSSLAAALLAATLLPMQAANAGTSINGQISQVANALRNNAYFSPTSFTFTINTASGPTTLFSGLAGARAFNDLQTVNDWVAQSAPPAPANDVYAGGPYTFTHSVLGSYFDQLSTPAEAPQYQAAIAAAPEFVAMAMPNAPIPEPATWAMMVGGLAVAGFALRRSRDAAVSFV